MSVERRNIEEMLIGRDIKYPTITFPSNDSQTLTDQLHGFFNDSQKPIPRLRSKYENDYKRFILVRNPKKQTLVAAIIEGSQDSRLVTIPKKLIFVLIDGEKQEISRAIFTLGYLNIVGLDFDHGPLSQVDLNDTNVFHINVGKPTMPPSDFITKVTQALDGGTRDTVLEQKTADYLVQSNKFDLDNS